MKRDSPSWGLAFPETSPLLSAGMTCLRRIGNVRTQTGELLGIGAHRDGDGHRIEAGIGFNDRDWRPRDGTDWNGIAIQGASRVVLCST